MKRNVEKEIDLFALEHNILQVKKHAPHSKILAMIKANAYGHGAALIAKTLSSHVNAFGVAHIEEALFLRRSGISSPIVLTSSALTTEQLHLASKEQFQWVIHDASQLSLLQNTTLEHPLTAWLKIDTGMHRLGFLPQDAPHAWETLKNDRNIQNVILMTHFAAADDLTNQSTAKQIARFNEITKNWNAEKSLANSAGILAWPHAHADWIRPGIMLYGISPFSEKTGHDMGLKPVMRLTAPIIAIHTFEQNDAIGYGGTYSCPEKMPVGVIGVGYGDGYPRQAPTGTPVWINGHVLPLIGRVSMDLITVDLRAYPQAKIGEKAILWGPELPIETISKYTGLFSYELACHAGVI